MLAIRFFISLYINFHFTSVAMLTILCWLRTYLNIGYIDQSDFVVIEDAPMPRGPILAEWCTWVKRCVPRAHQHITRTLTVTRIYEKKSDTLEAPTHKRTDTAYKRYATFLFNCVLWSGGYDNDRLSIGNSTNVSSFCCNSPSQKNLRWKTGWIRTSRCAHSIITSSGGAASAKAATRSQSSL